MHKRGRSGKSGQAELPYLELSDHDGDGAEEVPAKLPHARKNLTQEEREEIKKRIRQMSPGKSEKVAHASLQKEFGDIGFRTYQTLKQEAGVRSRYATSRTHSVISKEDVEQITERLKHVSQATVHENVAQIAADLTLHPDRVWHIAKKAGFKRDARTSKEDVEQITERLKHASQDTIYEDVAQIAADLTLKPKNVWHFAKKAGFIRDLRAGRKKSQAAPMLPEQVARVPDPSGKETAASGSPPQGSGSFNEPQTQTQGAQWSVLGEATAQNPVVPASEWIPKDELPRYSEGGDDLNRKEAKELVKGALEGEPNVQYYEGLLNSSLAEYIAEEFESRTGNRALLSGLALRHIAAYNTARDNTDGTSPFHQFQSQPKQPLWEEAVGSQTVGSIGGSSSFTGGLGGLRVEGRPGVGWQGQDPNAPSWDASDFRTYATHASSHLQSVPAAWTPRTGYTQPYSERQEGPRSPTSVQWNEEEKPDQGNDPQYGAADNFATGPSTAITSSYAPSRGWYTGSRGYGTGQPSGDFPSMDQSVPTSTFEQSRAKFFPASRAAQVYGGASVYQEPTGTSGHQKPQTFESSGYSEEQQVTYPEQGQEYH
jgi:hypothetical protein